MTGHRLLPGTDARLRVAPWRGDATIAHLTPGRSRPTAGVGARGRSTSSPRTGYASGAHRRARRRRSSARSSQAGFEVHERLHLLVRDPRRPARRRAGPPTCAAATTPTGPASSRSTRPRSRPSGGSTAPGLDDALAATPSRPLPGRGRRGTRPRRIVGYAVTGRAGPRGYLQRLAVDPPAQRAGIGGALVVDGLRWLRRWGAKEVLVNTQEGNDAAVRLYEALGFRLQPDGLAVLRRALGEAS